MIFYLTLQAIRRFNYLIVKLQQLLTIFEPKEIEIISICKRL